MTRRSGSARLIVMAFAGLLIAAEARADPMPSGLRGKSLVLNWSRTFTVFSGGGMTNAAAASGQLHTVANYLTVKVYVSLQGRVFSSLRQKGGLDHNAVSGTGNNVLNWQFEGGALIADQAFVQGARRITVNFGDGFDTCSLNVIYGKQDGTATIIVKTDQGGGEVEEDNNVIASTSCSVQQGNIFGDAK